MRFASLLSAVGLVLLTLAASPASAETAVSTTAPPTVSSSSQSESAPASSAASTSAGPGSSTPSASSTATASPSPSTAAEPSAGAAPTSEKVQPQVEAQVAATPPPVNEDPYGHVSLTGTADGVAFDGYALDPSDLGAPVVAMFTVDGVISSFSRADRPSPQLYPYGVVAPHGLSGVIGTSASDGTVWVCMFLFNVGAGVDTLAQCGDVTLVDNGPSGAVSATVLANGDISVSAYAYDPNAYASSPVVWITDNGNLKTARYANDPNPSLAPYGIPGAHGANVSYFPSTEGQHTICLYIVNIGPGQSRWVDCDTVTVTFGEGFHNPRGSFQIVNGVQGITAVGWAFDASDLNQSVTVMWTVDGAVSGYSVANMASDYLGLPGQHATVARLAASAGQHYVCMFVGNIGPGSSQLVQCEDVVVTSGWVLPVDNSVYTSCYCARWGTFHNGVDLAAPVGRPIKAANDGVVTFAGPVSGYGNLIVLKHPESGIYTAYAHMYTVGVYVGQYVAAGQQIAPVGAYGNVTGPHLHLETWYGPAMYQGRVDPATWLASQGVQLPPYAN